MKHFTLDEFKCKCGCGANEIKHRLMLKIDDARAIAGVTFIVTSGYRCPTHNRAVGGVDDSAHTRGFAVDIKSGSSASCFSIVEAILLAGFTRIGVYDTFIHADVDPERPSRLMWRGHG